MCHLPAGRFETTVDEGGRVVVRDVDALSPRRGAARAAGGGGAASRGGGATPTDNVRTRLNHSPRTLREMADDLKCGLCGTHFLSSWSTPVDDNRPVPRLCASFVLIDQEDGTVLRVT